MKINIDVPDWIYEEIKEEKFPAHKICQLIEWIKEDKIIEDKIDDLVEIGTLEAGTTIEVGGIQMEILNNMSYIAKGNEIGVFCLAKDILFNKAFNEDNHNNWEESSLRKYLNGRYKESLDKKLVDALIPFRRYLLTDDGMRNYGKECGTCTDMISLISHDEYREYREYISDKSNWWWTLTAWSAKPNNSNIVRRVDRDGVLTSACAYRSYIGVVPVFLLSPSLRVKIVKK